jgi:hypothetical protein
MGYAPCDELSHLYQPRTANHRVIRAAAHYVERCTWTEVSPFTCGPYYTSSRGGGTTTGRLHKGQLRFFMGLQIVSTSYPKPFTTLAWAVESMQREKQLYEDMHDSRKSLPALYLIQTMDP